MNRNRFLPLFGSLLILIGACQERNHTQQAAKVQEALPFTVSGKDTETGKEVEVDPDRSIIFWKGTKLKGTGQHEGTIRIKNGTLYFDQEKLTGGSIIVDMHRIKITDIPPTDPIPIRNLTNHLNSDFATEAFPTSEFTLTQVAYKNSSVLEITGNLSIKGITRLIAVPAQIQDAKGDGKYFTSEFTFNRFDWNIGSEGSWLAKKLVDEDILLRIEIWTTPDKN